MSFLLTNLFGPRKNTPEETPPPIPTGRKIIKKDKGIYLTEYVFNVKWQIMEERMSNTNTILTVAIGALVICFITLFYGYWQFASVSLNDYRDKVKELNDERYQLLKNQIMDLEKISTPSANN